MSDNFPETPHNGGDDKITIVIDLEEYFHKGEKHPEHDPGVIIIYRLKVDGKLFDVKHRHMTGIQILELVGLTPEHFLLFQVIKEHGHVKEVPIALDEKIDFGAFGVERFITKPVTYCFWVDKREYHSEQQELTVKEILVNYAEVNPADKTLAQKKDGTVHEYKNLDDKILLKDCPHFTLLDNTPTTVS